MDELQGRLVSTGLEEMQVGCRCCRGVGAPEFYTGHARGELGDWGCGWDRWVVLGLDEMQVR